MLGLDSVIHLYNRSRLCFLLYVSIYDVLFCRTFVMFHQPDISCGVIPEESERFLQEFPESFTPGSLERFLAGLLPEFHNTSQGFFPGVLKVIPKTLRGLSKLFPDFLQGFLPSLSPKLFQRFFFMFFFEIISIVFSRFCYIFVTNALLVEKHIVT